ncbi:hypothetical protein H4R21_001127 [Coemansia helicoidea]|uniref:Uncharacterized protein n=1 Tax=Coemansia helicoidea TaxID=1286919 RepID=A0ACC1LD53_9FUNG|nr:hypothetical protein H4R21_001127 [Coemansia helicoidea]
MLTIAVLSAIVVPTCVTYAKKHDSRDRLDPSLSHANGTVPSSVGDKPGTFNGTQDTALASFNLHFSSLDPLALMAQARLTLGQRSTYRDIDDGSYTLVFNGDQKTINSSSPANEWSYHVNIVGDIGRYPFDTYEDEGTFFAFAPEQTLNNGIASELYVSGSHTGWSFKTSAAFKDGVYLVGVTASRQHTTKGFSLFVVILSWALSLCQLFIAAQSLIRNRPVVPPMLAVPATMLFALPSLRNVQPGVPPIGIVLDFAGFYWNMALVALSLITLSLMFIFQFEV